MRAALYARVSTDRQVEKYGIPSQLDALKGRCSMKVYLVVQDGEAEAFIDDGYSGESLDRPALNRLRDVVKARQVDLVLVYDPDRLSRKLFHQMLLAEEFEKHEVKLEFITQEMGDSPEDRMFFNMRGLVAEYEREKIKERTLRGKLHKAREGKVVTVQGIPYGYRYNPETALLEIHDDKAKIVRFIFYTFAHEPLSLVGLATKLTRLGIPAPRGGVKWGASSLGRMLRNEAYIGKLYQFRYAAAEPRFRKDPSVALKNKRSARRQRPENEWLTVNTEPIVPVELFESVGRKLTQNGEWSRRNAKRQYLLSGLIRCPICKGRLGGFTRRGKPYYRCYKKLNINAALDNATGKFIRCKCPDLPAETIEPVVWDTIAGLLRNPDFLIEELHRRTKDDSETKRFLEEELTRCRERLEALPRERKRVISGYRKGLYADFMVREEMESIDQEQKELEKHRAELEKRLSQIALLEGQETKIRNLVERIRENLDRLDFAQRQELLRLLIVDIVVSDQKVHINTIIPLEGLGTLHPRGCAGAQPPLRRPKPKH